MEFRLLGHVEVVGDDGPLPLGAAKQRALLVALLLHAGRTVADDELVDWLWEGEPPPSAANSLQVLVSRLRRVLGADRIVRRGEGYALLLDDGELDVERFDALVAHGRSLLDAGDAPGGAEALRRAEELWRSPAVADFRYAEFARPAAARLDELRLAAVEDRIEAELAAGLLRDLAAELEALVAQHPYRERFRAQLIVALYRAGRQADALAAYREARRKLHDELGIEPSPALRELERRILRQDPTLRPRAPAPRGRRRPTRVAAAVGLAVVVVLLVAATRHRPESVAVVANSVAVVGPSSTRIVGDVPLPVTPELAAAGGRSLWIGAASTNAVVRVDVAEGRVADPGRPADERGRPHGRPRPSRRGRCRRAGPRLGRGGAVADPD